MSASVQTVALSALIPVATTALGALIAAIRPPGAAVRSGTQHFAAGVVVAVVAVELLPDVVRVHDPVEIGVAFAAQLLAVGIDVFIDGLLVGIAFAAGAKAGVLLTLALSLELLSLGLALAAPLAAAGVGRVRTVLVPTALACLLPVGALVGETVLRGASAHTLAGVLAFGAAALLYLVTEELLVEAHETRDTTAATAMFFAGFLLFLLLGMAA